jgi:GrpB-like predicted nucleotidyltransferase (UPF0157 family)
MIEVPNGLSGGRVELRHFTTEWTRLFERERDVLMTVLSDRILDIQHVGSTAIPGMVAKPILDIGIAVRDFEEARRCIQPIEGLGYLYRGEYGIPRRHYFVKGNPRTYHIHMLEIESDEWRGLLLFRDMLRNYPESADEYARLKQDLAERYAGDRQSYQEGKREFINSILRRAKNTLSGDEERD